MTNNIPIIPREYLPFEKLPVDQRVAAIKKAKSLLSSGAPDLQPCDLYMSKKNWRHIFNMAKINQKNDYIRPKSRKTERKVSR